MGMNASPFVSPVLAGSQFNNLSSNPMGGLSGGNQSLNHLSSNSYNTTNGLNMTQQSLDALALQAQAAHQYAPGSSVSAWDLQRPSVADSLVQVPGVTDPRNLVPMQRKRKEQFGLSGIVCVNVFVHVLLFVHGMKIWNETKNRFSY